MTQGKTPVPAVDGWFTIGSDGGSDGDPDGPALLGSRCTTCGTYFFPKETHFCRNPACAGTEFDDVRLSRRGTVWSYTDNRYQPPAPYVSPDPFVPYAVAAVELAEERMVVLGQVAGGIDELRVGVEVELVLDTLHEDDDHEYLVWKWKPTS